MALIQRLGDYNSGRITAFSRRRWRWHGVDADRPMASTAPTFFKQALVLATLVGGWSRFGSDADRPDGLDGTQFARVDELAAEASERLLDVDGGSGLDLIPSTALTAVSW